MTKKFLTPIILPVDPAAPMEAATKQYVDSTTVYIGGDEMTGALGMNGNTIYGLPVPTADDHVANKQYVDAQAGGGGGGPNVVSYLGNWSNATTYVNRQQVRHFAATWMCVVASSLNRPPGNIYADWQLVGGVPQMTTTEFGFWIANDGEVGWNTTTNVLTVREAGAWVPIGHNIKAGAGSVQTNRAILNIQGNGVASYVDDPGNNATIVNIPGVVDGEVTNAKLANMVASTIKGRISSTGVPQDLTPAMVVGMLPNFGGAAGLAPASGQTGTAFLRDDGVWTGNISAATRKVIKSSTGTAYVPILTDENHLINCSNISANTVTMPSDATLNFPIGAEINFFQGNVGQTAFVAGSGATVLATPGLKLRTRYSVATAIKTSANTWLLTGDISA